MKRAKYILIYLISSIMLTSCANKKIFTHDVHNGSYLHCSICTAKKSGEVVISKSSENNLQENNMLVSNEKGINQVIATEIYEFDNLSKSSNYKNIAAVKHFPQNKILKSARRISLENYPLSNTKNKEIKHPGLNYALAGLLILGLFILIIDYELFSITLLPFIGLFLSIKALRNSSKGDVLVKCFDILGILLNILTSFVLALYIIYTYLS